MLQGQCTQVVVASRALVNLKRLARNNKNELTCCAVFQLWNMRHWYRNFNI